MRILWSPPSGGLATRWSPALAGLALTAASWALGVQASAPVLAQSAQPQSTEQRFEVASVKPSVSPYELGRLAGRGLAPAQEPQYGIRTQPSGRFIAAATLRQLIAEAFDVKDYQIEGGPEWLATDYFEITANAGPDATSAEVKGMLRTLLNERFGLRIHSDTRQAPVYVLTIARSDGRLGPRLTPASPECLQLLEQRRNGTAPPSAPRTSAEVQADVKRLASGDAPAPRCGSSMMGSRSNGVSTLSFGGMALETLVSRVSNELSAPAIDRTGLSGLFDVSFEYLSEKTINGRPAGLDPNSIDRLPPLLPGALQQQLGLKLDKQIGPMPVVVIEAAERPTPD